MIERTPRIRELAGKHILITGAGGLVCSAIADVLLRCNEQHDLPIAVIAAGRSEIRIRERFARYAEAPYFHFLPYDATKAEICIPYPVDYIIHGAGNATPDRITEEPVETMLGNFMGLYGLLHFAGEHSVKRLLYISSSEVYGKKDDSRPFRETEYGAIDLLNPRNSYSVSKRAAETLCASFAKEYGVETVIARPGHVYGPTASRGDGRVSSRWAYDAAAGRDLVMKSDGAQIRSYCHCLDAASAILTVLLKGEANQAYNISNSDSVISIRQMAEMLAVQAGVSLVTDRPTEEEQKSFNPMANSSLDNSRLSALGWKGCFDAETGFAHTLQILKETGC